jgi:hypothetical protein
MKRWHFGRVVPPAAPTPETGAPTFSFEPSRVHRWPVVGPTLNVSAPAPLASPEGAAEPTRCPECLPNASPATCTHTRSGPHPHATFSATLTGASPGAGTPAGLDPDTQGYIDALERKLAEADAARVAAERIAQELWDTLDSSQQRGFAEEYVPHFTSGTAFSDILAAARAPRDAREEDTDG